MFSFRAVWGTPAVMPGGTTTGSMVVYLLGNGAADAALSHQHLTHEALARTGCPRLSRLNFCAGQGYNPLVERGGYAAAERSGRVFPLLRNTIATTKCLLCLGVGHLDDAGWLHVCAVSHRVGTQRESGARISD